MEALHPEVFRTCFAIGWIDGELRESESHLILEAAAAEGYDEATMADLRKCAADPVDFGEIDQSRLSPRERLYVYGVCSWIARTDGRVSTDEQAALHAVATVIGITGRGRVALDEAVASLGGTGGFDRTALRGTIDRLLAHP